QSALQDDGRSHDEGGEKEVHEEAALAADAELEAAQRVPELMPPQPPRRRLLAGRIVRSVLHLGHSSIPTHGAIQGVRRETHANRRLRFRLVHVAPRAGSVSDGPLTLVTPA